MEISDTYGGCRIKTKLVEVYSDQYNVGDTVPLADGIYICYEGAIVVKGGIFIMETEDLFDKWGRSMFPDEILDR